MTAGSQAQQTWIRLNQVLDNTEEVRRTDDQPGRLTNDVRMCPMRTAAGREDRSGLSLAAVCARTY